MKEVIAVILGGALGSGLRYATGKALRAAFAKIAPWETFLINMLGCFAIGFFIAYLSRTGDRSNVWRAFWTAGFCGGFTTFSAFAFENQSLLGEGRFGVASFYVLASVAAGIILVGAGLAAGRTFS